MLFPKTRGARSFDEACPPSLYSRRFETTTTRTKVTTIGLRKNENLTRVCCDCSRPSARTSSERKVHACVYIYIYAESIAEKVIYIYIYIYIRSNWIRMGEFDRGG